MTRYKGRASAKSIALGFPHVVETRVPLGGFRERLDDIYEFHRQRGIAARLFDWIGSAIIWDRHL
jgi:hypothetical protein